MSTPVVVADHSANSQKIADLRDVQVEVLAQVLGANIRHALDEALGASRWLENMCVDWHPYPVTIGLLNDHRLPAISVWRTQTMTMKRKKRVERRATFAIRYWLDSTPMDWLPRSWGALQMAYEAITRTLTGEACIDLLHVDTDGKHRVPSSELLVAAGFTVIHDGTIRGVGDFAQAEDGTIWPVLEVTFDAEHLPLFGGLPYSLEFPNGVDLSELKELCFQLWDGTPEAEGGRGDENQPIVAGKSLVERSADLLSGSQSEVLFDMLTTEAGDLLTTEAGDVLGF